MNDMNDWVGQPRSQGDYYEHPERHEHDEKHDAEAILADRRSLPVLMLPLAFFFMPGRFMRSFGVHCGPAFLFLVIWITGAASTVSSLENRSMFGGQNVLSIDSWAMLWGVGVFAGIIRGYVIYGLGGLWYRLRLRMCGYDAGEWSETGRVYMLAGLAKQGTYLIYMLWVSTQFATFDAYLQDNSTSLAVTFGYIAAAMLMEILASVTLYCGSVAVFPIKRAWAAVWFLVLPIAMRVTATGALFAVAWFGVLVPPPQIDTPSKHSGNLIEMEYPRNWTIYEDDTSPGSHFWVQSVPLIGDAIFEVELVYKNEDVPVFEYCEDSWAERVEFELGEIREEGEKTVAGKPGQLRDRIVSMSGSDYVMQEFYYDLGDYYVVLVSMIAPSGTWDTIEPGFEHMVRTLRTKDPLRAEPDLKNTYTARVEELQFEMPGNWWVYREVMDDTEHEDGTVTTGTRSLEARGPGDGYVSVYLYESSSGPRSELGASLEALTQDGRLENEQQFGDWEGREGFGARGQTLFGDALWDVMIFVTETEDGRLLEIRRLVPAELKGTHQPGFDLIERTFELREIEPESP